MPSHSGEAAARVLIETLRLGRSDKSVEVNDIASRAKASKSFALEVLTSIMGKVDDSRILLGSTLRVRIAIEAARAGRLRDAAQAISWRGVQGFDRQSPACAGVRNC